MFLICLLVIWAECFQVTDEVASSLNSLAPGKFEWSFKYVIFKQILVIDGWGMSSEIALICHWTSLMINQHWFR